MTTVKKISMIILAIGALFLLIAVWYKYTYSMDEAQAYTVNQESYTQKLCIATQGSTFKDSVTSTVVNHFKNKSVYIQVADISKLPELELKEYDALLIVHTWENWEAPEVVSDFINSHSDYNESIVVITTSGEGSYKMPQVDAITGESKIDNVVPMSEKAIEKLEHILQQHKPN